MPYADLTSEAAIASVKKAKLKYYNANRERMIARSAKWNKDNSEKVNIAAVTRRSEKLTPEKVLWTNAKNRARRKGLPFNLDVEDCVVPEYCPVLGLKLEIATGHAKDNSPSIDRIIPERGYVKGNIAIISHRANTIKSQASLGELERVAKWLKEITEGLEE